MTIEMLYHNHPEYLLVKVCGQWTEKDIKQAVNEIRTEADRRGFKRLLLDLRELHRPGSRDDSLLVWGILGASLTASIQGGRLCQPRGHKQIRRNRCGESGRMVPNLFR